MCWRGRIRSSNKKLNASLTPLLVRPKDFSALPPAKVRFVEPMYALPVQKLPQGQEVKFDGYVERLDEHIKKCPPAAFTFEGTTGVATQRLDALRSFHEGDRRAGKVRL